MEIKQQGRADRSAYVPMCYHCGVRKHNLVECEVWNIYVCHACIETLHSSQHESCRKTGSKKKAMIEKVEPSNRNFTLHVTHYSGKDLFFECHRGTALKLEEHWAGTYMLFASGMILVLEDKAEINQRIIEGLKSMVE